MYPHLIVVRVHFPHHDVIRQDLLPVSQNVANHWAQKFHEIQEYARKEEKIDLIWGLVDGFLLYWHPVRPFSPICILPTPRCVWSDRSQDVIRELDVRLFLRVSYGTLKARREKRFGYHTAG